MARPKGSKDSYKRSSRTFDKEEQYKKKLEYNRKYKQERKPYLLSEPWTCELCKKSTMYKHSIKRHLKSKKHIKNDLKTTSQL